MQMAAGGGTTITNTGKFGLGIRSPGYRRGQLVMLLASWSLAGAWPGFTHILEDWLCVRETHRK